MLNQNGNEVDLIQWITFNSNERKFIIFANTNDSKKYLNKSLTIRVHAFTD